MGLSPEEWRRALATTGASPDTLGLFEGLDDEALRRMRLEQEQREREETERAVERELMAANGAPDYDARAARGDFGGYLPRELPANPYEEDAPPDMAITPEEVASYEQAQRAPEPATAPSPDPSRLPQRNQEILAAYRARALPKMEPGWEPGRADAGVRKELAPAGTVGELGDTGVAPAFQLGAPPAAVNTALARTGSDYRLPEQQQPDPMRDEARFATEVPIAKAESFQRQADLKGQEATRQREVTEQSRANVEGRRQQMRAFEAQAVDRLNRITALVDSPPEESRNAGRAIMGAILSVASRGRVSDGREQMAQQMKANVERWKSEIAGNREAMDALLSMSKHQGSVAEFDAKLDQTLLEYEFGALNAALDQEKLQAQSKEQYHAAEQAQRTLIGGYVRSQLYTMPLPDLARAVQGGDVGEEGQKIFQERAEAEMKMQKGDLDLRKGEQDIAQGRLAMDLTRSQIAKNEREGLEGPKLSDGERKSLRMFEGVAPSVDRLREMAAGRGAPHPYASNMPDLTRSAESMEDEAALKNVSLALLRDESGAALPPGEQAEKRASWGIDSGDPAVRKHGLGLMLAEYDARIGGITRGREGAGGGGSGGMQYGTGGGLAPGGGTPAPSAAGGGGARLVDMVNPETGQTARVAPDKVARAQAMGFVVGRPSPKELPRDDAPLRETYRQSRDGGVGAGD